MIATTVCRPARLRSRAMGCGASTPVKDSAPGKATSAASAADLRRQDGSQHGPNFDVGPHYKLGKHLGACRQRRLPPRPPRAPHCRAPRPAAQCPCPPLSPTAGRGGTGDTWSFTDTRTNKEVAIKFIKRPMPKVLVQNIQREFTVRRRRRRRPPPPAARPLDCFSPSFFHAAAPGPFFRRRRSRPTWGRATPT